MANARTKAIYAGLSRPLGSPEAESAEPEQAQFAYEEDPRSLLTEVTGPIVGAVGAVGNLLDLPGSMARDVLTLNNPLDQLATPFSSENRIGGREMLTQWGLTNPNKETGISGWVDDPSEGVQDVLGFAAEVALDPLNLLTGGTTKAAAIGADGAVQGAKAGRGLINNLTDPLRLGELGQRIGAPAALRRATQGTGRMVSRSLNALEAAPKVGGLVGSARSTANRIGRSTKLAFRSMFDSAVRGARTELGQRLMRDFTRAKNSFDDAVKVDMLGFDQRMDAALREAHGDYLKSADELAEGELPIRQQIYEEIREVTEGVDSEFTDFKWLNTPELREIAEDLRGNEEMIASLRDRGVVTGPLKDDAIDHYMPREQGDSVKAEFREARGEGEGVFENGPRRVVNAASQSTTHKDEALVNWYTGTAGVNRMYRDEELAEVIESVRRDYNAGDLKGKVPAKALKRVRNTIDDLILDSGQTAGQVFDDVIKKIADDRGLVSMEDFSREMSRRADLIEKVGKQASLSLSSGKNPFPWVIAGKQKKFHVLDSVTETELSGDFVKRHLRRDKDMPNQLGSIESGGDIREVGYEQAKSHVRGNRYNVTPDVDIARVRADAEGIIAQAERERTSVYARFNDAGEITDVMVPRTANAVSRRMRAQIANLGKKFSGEQTLSSTEILDLQEDAAKQFIRNRYGDEIIDEMPRRSEHGQRITHDYRDGKTGNRHELSEEQYEKLLDQDMVTSDLQEAMDSGKVYEVVDSRIDDAIVPKIFRPDGGYSANRKLGLFTNSPVADAVQRRIQLNETKLRVDTLEKFVEEFIGRGDAYDATFDAFADTADNTIETLLLSQKGGIHEKKFLEHIVKKRNPQLAKPKNAAQLADEIDRVRRIKISSADWSDIASALDINKPSLVNLPGTKSATEFFDAATRLFKTGVLSWPGRVVRDFTSAAIRSIESGMLDLSSPGRAMQSAKLGNALATGRFHSGFAELLEKSPGLHAEFAQSQFRRMMDDNPNLSLDEAVFKYVQSRFYMEQGGAYLHTNMDMADSLRKMSEMGSMQPLRDNINNLAGTPLKGLASETASSIRKDGLAALNPVEIEGLPHVLTGDPSKIGKVRDRSRFFADRIIGGMGRYTDAVTRGTAVIDQMRRGASFEQAFARANDTLVNYDPRRFSNFERDVMKRLFPFYSFLSSQVPYVLKELSSNPTGGLGQMVRAQRHSQDEEYVPYRLRDRAAINLGTDEQGNQNYLSGLGLMHEDAIAMLQPDLADILGDMNPYLKAPVELATGRSLFMKGPLGGAALSELDPGVGRIAQRIGEITGLREPTGQRPPSPIGATGEHLIANSPAGRLVNSVRTALDNRKSYTARAANLLTGFKTTTISPEQQQSMLRSELDAILKEQGVRPFTRYSLRKDDIGEIEASGNKELAYRLRAVEKVRAILDKARKDKLKAQKETEQ